MGVAILIPFTFVLQPIEGLLLLGGVYVGSIYGGSITAILLNIPGAPANIATGLDGHVLAQRGEGQRALYLAVGLSVIGGLAGVLALLYLSPPLVQLALQFGTAERFWVALLGITIIGSLSSDSVMKGIIGGAFGMLLGIIGVSTITGASRYTRLRNLAFQ